MSEQCNRSGMCCTMFWLPYSPEDLKEQAKLYSEYLESNSDNPWIGERTDEIYRMVGDRLIGKKKKENFWLYGPCKNLGYTEENGKQVPTCMIQDNKPNMCKGFPKYEIGLLKNTKSNPSEYKGCGFNQDPKFGLTLKQIECKIEK